MPFLVSTFILLFYPRLETTILNMEATISKNEGLQGDLDRMCKELKEKESSLEALKEEKQKLSEQLDKVCAGAKKNSVLSLEMADMEVGFSCKTSSLFRIAWINFTDLVFHSSRNQYLSSLVSSRLSVRVLSMSMRNWNWSGLHHYLYKMK